MSKEIKPDDLVQYTKAFIQSEYGSYLIDILQETAQGCLADVANIKTEHPDRYAAKYSAYKEVLELIHQPLEDSTPTHG